MRKQKRQDAGSALAPQVESPTWGSRVMRVLGALRQDGWQSTLGGLGSRGDRGRPGSVAFIEQLPLTDYELTNAYRNLWLVRRLVEGLPDDALREGFGVEDAAKELPEFMRLNYSGHHSEGAFERALRMSELKGGAGIYLGYEVQGPEELLEPIVAGATPRPLAFIEVFDRFQLTGEQPDLDTHSPTYDQPQVWCVTGQRRSGMRFHTSRLIKIKGAPLAGDLGLTHDEKHWGDSVLQAVWADVQRYGVFWQSVSHLMQLSSVGVLKIAGLIEMLASQSQDAAQARVDLLNESMSLTRLMLLDAKHDEEYHREAVSFTDMPALLQEVQLATAGAFKRPVTKLFGRSPAGMNATGESDMRMWYDEVACYQQRQVKPALEALLLVTDGFTGDLEFAPLWQESEREQAETRKITIDANERLWSMGVVGPEEIRASMFEGEPIEKQMAGAPPEEAGPVAQANAKPKPTAPGFSGGSPVSQAEALLADEDDADAVINRARQQVAERLSAYKLQRAAYAKLEASLKQRRVAAKAALTEAKAEVERLKTGNDAAALKAARSNLKTARAADGDAKDRYSLDLIAFDEQNNELQALDALNESVAEYREQVGSAAFAAEVERDVAYSEAFEAHVESLDEGVDPPEEGEDLPEAAKTHRLRAAEERLGDLEAHQARLEAGGDSAKGAEKTAQAVQEGPRGGRFYVSKSGTKVYPG